MKEKAQLLKREQMEKEFEEAKTAARAIEAPKPAFTALKPAIMEESKKSNVKKAAPAKA